MIFHRCWFIGVWGVVTLGVLKFPSIIAWLPGLVIADSFIHRGESRTLYALVAIGSVLAFVMLCSWLMDRARLSKVWVLVMMVALIAGGCLVLFDGYEFHHWHSLPEVAAAEDYTGVRYTFSDYVRENLMPKILGDGMLFFYAVLLCGGLTAMGKIAWATARRKER